MYDYGQTWPSTGLVGLYSICLSYDDITIHGFDGWDKAYKYYHYFDKNEDRVTEMVWRGEKMPHKLGLEVEAMNFLRKEYSINGFY